MGRLLKVGPAGAVRAEARQLRREVTGDTLGGPTGTEGLLEQSLRRADLRRGVREVRQQAGGLPGRQVAAGDPAEHLQPGLRHPEVQAGPADPSLGLVGENRGREK